MTNIILQPFGLGDHIFTQELIKQICTGPVRWGVQPQFLEGLQRAYPAIEWVEEIRVQKYQTIRADTIIEDKRIVPIRYANTILGVPYTQCMSSKYQMYGLDWRTWRNAMYNRDVTRETKLAELLKLPAEYNLINNRFRSNESGVVPIEVSNGLPNIVMDNYKGFSLFDWSYIIENATNIHMVGSSMIYLTGLLDVKAKKMHLYKRLPDENHFENYDYILERHRYIFH